MTHISYTMQEINIFLFQFFNQFASLPFFGTIIPILADLPIFFLPAFLLWSWIYIRYKDNNDTNKKHSLLFIFYAAIVAIIISLIIQQFVDIDRPETAVAGAGKLLLEHIPDASFPSDHASVSVAFLMALFFTGYKKVFWAFLPWVIIMNISRIIAGVHWPFDIIAGSVVWIVAAYIATKELPKIKFVKSLNNFIIHIVSYIKL